MSNKNRINLILHAHLPYVRHLEYPRFLEEDWLFESLNESYIPLLSLMDRLDEEGIDFKVTFCFSPTLLTMLTDEALNERFASYMKLHMELGRKEEQRLKGEKDTLRLASMYLKKLEMNWKFYEDNGNSIIPVLKRLNKNGRIELMTTAATHAYLPLYMEYPTAIEAQVSLGISTFHDVFGYHPDGFWLPECGYYPGLDEVLKKYGIKYCQLPSHSVISSRDKSLGGGYRPVELPSGVNGFVRDWSITSLIWNSTSGYPCDVDYREFYRDIGYDLPLDYIRPYIHEPDVRVFTGFKYFKITGRTDEKALYDPDKARSKVALHVDNYLYHIARKGIMLSSFSIDNPLFNLCYDAELFGHRWYEGIEFLEQLLRKCADSDDVKKEYEILLGELVKYNPDLAEKPRALAITKCDMLDEELMREMERELPEGVPHVFISAVAQMGIQELKDLLWKELNRESFHEVERIVHKNIDVKTLQFDDDDDDFVFPEDDEDEEEYIEYEDWDEDEDEEEQTDGNPSPER